jgi:hypothetical protein
MPVVAVVWKKATYEFGFSRARHFNSLTRPDGIIFKESDTKSDYSTEEITEYLKSVDSSVDVPWSEYGPVPR